MTNAMLQSDYVRELTMFALRRKGKCFDGWTPQQVFRFIAFHVLASTIEAVREGRALLGVGIGYTGDESYFRQMEGKAFDYRLPEPGSVLFVAGVIANRRAVTELWTRALNKYPWISKVMTYRNGKLVELHLRQLNRLANMEVVNG